MSIPPVRAVLVAVGDELLAGDHLNGNGAILGQALSAIGVRVVRHAVVGDDVDDIARAVRGAVAAGDLVIVCGGLGPTQDDVTREALAAAAGVPLERDAALETALVARFAALGRSDVPAMNWRQADLPRGARPLPNDVGTAPGLLLAFGTVPVYALPGVPRELSGMLTGAVLPDVQVRFPSRPAVARHVVRTVGMWESAVATAMAPEVARTAGSPAIAFLASGGETRVVITAAADDAEQAEALAAPTVDFARAVLGEAVYDGPNLETAVVHLLGARGATVACAESLTAGALSARVANVPGASAVLRGGVVAYATGLKHDLLEVSRLRMMDDGVVSAATARAMATGVAERCSSDYGVALTGVAGPSEQEGHQPGTVFAAVHGPRGVSARQLMLPGDRAQVRALAVTTALAMLRLAIVQDARDTSPNRQDRGRLRG